MGSRPTNGPLSRFTVLELTIARAGPTCGRMLADWGANVIKIEPRSEVEGPSAMGGKEFRNASDFQNLHRNRRAMTLNLKNPEGVKALYKMIEKADVFVENFRPDVKKRLGFDYETLSKHNPKLVYCSLSGFGQTGPYAQRPGVDQIAQGLGGLMGITGETDGPPMRVGIAIADVSTGIMAAFGILAALHEREVSGKGQHISTSLLQNQIYLLDFQAARWLQEGEIAERAGNNHPTLRPTGVFKASDGYFNIATVPPMWGKFCKVLGLDWMENDPAFAKAPERVTNSDRMTQLINEVTIKQPMAVWIEKLNEAGVPCGPIYNMDQVFDDPQVVHMGIAKSVPSDHLGELKQVRAPLDMSRTPQVNWAGAPERGAHTREVLKEFGMSDADVDKLVEGNAV